MNENKENIDIRPVIAKRFYLGLLILSGIPLVYVVIGIMTHGPYGLYGSMEGSYTSLRLSLLLGLPAVIASGILSSLYRLGFIGISLFLLLGNLLVLVYNIWTGVAWSC